MSDDDDDDSLAVKIWVHGFEEADVRRVAQGLDRVVAERQSFAPVYIHTDGGSTWGLAAMLDLFAACPVPVATIAMGKALSAGADLLAAGHRGARWVSSHTSIMVHEAIEGIHPKKMPELETILANSRRENAMYLALLDKHTGKRPGWWAREIKKRGNTDWWMSADEAVSVGLADHVGMPRIAVSTERKVELTFDAPTKPKRKKVAR